MNTSESDARRWYLQAVNDRRFTEWVFREEQFYDKGCFIAQQAGGKILKACLYAAGNRKVFGHSLLELCIELTRHTPAFDQIVEESKRMDRYYIPTRYPNGLPGGTPFETYSRRDLGEARVDLKKIFAVCEAYLSEHSIQIADENN